MTPLSRAQEGVINSALTGLERLDLNTVSRERVNKMIEEVTLLLNEGNILVQIANSTKDYLGFFKKQEPTSIC